MNNIKCSLLISLCFLLTLPCIQAQQGKKLKMWYDKPATVWNEALPIGNGRLAAMIFGNGVGKVPSIVGNLSMERSEIDQCVVKLKWNKTPEAIGYNIRYGTRKDKLYQNYQVFGVDSLTIRSLNSLHKYYFTIDAFNENGITKGENIVELN